jgi:membrane associated rhomboid family serine protease
VQILKIPSESRKAEGPVIEGNREKVKGKEPILPVVTLSFLATIVFLYVWFTGGSLLVSPPFDTVVGLYGLDTTLTQTYTYLTYALIHLYPGHLVMNIGLLVVFGTLLELRLRPHRAAVFFLLSILGPGVFFAAISPDTILVGASGLIWCCIGACVVSRPRESLIALFVMGFIVLPVLRSSITERVYDRLADGITAEWIATATVESTQNELRSVEDEVENKTITDVRLGTLEDEVTKNKTILERALVNGTISREEFVERTMDVNRTLGIISVERTRVKQSLSELNQRQQELSVRVEDANRQLEQVWNETQAYRETVQNMGNREADELHVFSLFYGYFLILLMEPSILDEWQERMVHWLALKNKYLDGRSGTEDDDLVDVESSGPEVDDGLQTNVLDHSSDIVDRVPDDVPSRDLSSRESDVLRSRKLKGKHKGTTRTKDSPRLSKEVSRSRKSLD